jgi:hypothetical protein
MYYTDTPLLDMHTRHIAKHTRRVATRGGVEHESRSFVSVRFRKCLDASRAVGGLILNVCICECFCVASVWTVERGRGNAVASHYRGAYTAGGRGGETPSYYTVTRDRWRDTAIAMVCSAMNTLFATTGLES